MNCRLIATAFVACAMASGAHAVLITPTDVGTDMGSYSGRPPVNTINNSGLGAPTAGGYDTHLASDPVMWQGGPDTGVFVFDLGAVYDVDDFVLWNGWRGASTTRGIEDFTLDFFDANNTLIGSRTTETAAYPSPVSSRIEAEVFSGSTVSSVNKVRLNINSSHSATDSGISEVKFEGTFVEAVSGVPSEDLISPVSATTTAGSFGGRDISQAADLSGFSGTPPLTTDDVLVNGNGESWMSAGSISFPADVTLTLDGPHEIEGIAMWGYGGNRSIQQFDLIFMDGDGATIATLEDFIATKEGVNGYDLEDLSDGGDLRGGLSGEAGNNAEVFRFSKISGVEAVTLRIDSNYGDASFVGLSEVAFLGQPVVPVPEPATCVLWSLGLFSLGLMGARRRKR